MKILSYAERDDMLVVTTDFTLMPEFVYPIDRFNSLARLEKEMEKKSHEVVVRRQRREMGVAMLKMELDSEVAANA